MSAQAELDPQVFQERQQTMENRWKAWGVSYEDAINYYASEYAWLTGQQVPVDPQDVLSHPDMLPMALFPNREDQEAINRWKIYSERTPEVGRRLLQPHVEMPGSLITPLDDDPVAHPAQHPLSYYVEGSPIERKYTDMTAEMVDPRYPEMIKSLGSDPNVTAAISSAIELLKDGKSVYVVTPHAGDLIDIAFAMKMVRDLMDDQDFEPENSIFNLAKSVAGWGQYEVPNVGPVEMTDVIKMIAHRIYTPWQNTDTSRDVTAQLPKPERDWNNVQVTEDTNEQMDRGGTLGALAPTGTTRIATNDPNVFNINQVNDGTIKLMTRENVYLLPLPLWRPGEDYVADVLKPVQVKTAEEAHAVMELMTASLTLLVKDKTFHYREL